MAPKWTACGFVGPESAKLRCLTSAASRDLLKASLFGQMQGTHSVGLDYGVPEYLRTPLVPCNKSILSTSDMCSWLSTNGLTYVLPPLPSLITIKPRHPFCLAKMLSINWTVAPPALFRLQLHHQANPSGLERKRQSTSTTPLDDVACWAPDGPSKNIP